MYWNKLLISLTQKSLLMANETCLLNRVVCRSSTRVYCWAVRPLSVRLFIIFLQSGVMEGFLFAMILRAALSAPSASWALQWADTFSEKTDVSRPFPLFLTLPRCEQFILVHINRSAVSPLARLLTWNHFWVPKTATFCSMLAFSPCIFQNCVKWTCSEWIAYYTMKLSRFKLYPSTLD